MALENILSQQIIQKLGWTLLHFVWQATAVALLLGILLALLRKSSASMRYIAACTALGLIILLPIVTMQLVQVSTPQPAAKIEPAPAPAVSPVESADQTPLTRAFEYMEMARPENIGTATPVHWKQQASELLESSLPYLVAGWLLGVFALSLWHLGGWAQLQRLRKKMVKQVDDSVRNRLCRLAEKLDVKKTVQLLESALVQVPTVVGWLRPVILLPASALTGLTTEQLEALLAHELAHIRRHDYLVNMLQTVVETLGFYHPAVWWISHRIRFERENCCDDLAVSISGDRISYARALTSMEEIRTDRSELAVAATGGNLFGRIRRLVSKDSTESSRTSWIPSIITIMLIAIIIIPTILALNSQAEDKIDDGLKIHAEGQQILKQMTQRNRYWLIGPPAEVRNYSYDFNLHSRRVPKSLQERATGSKSIEVENPSTSKKRMVQGIRYSSVLQKLAINPSAATITKLEHEKTKGRIRLDFTLIEPVRVECGNGISGQYLGYFGMNVSSGSLWLDSKNKVPIELKAAELMEHFSEYVEAGKSQYVPLRIGLHRYRTEDTGQDRSMHFEFKFNLFGPGLWLFDQSSYRQGKFDLPFSDKPLVAYTSNIKINGTPKRKTDIDVKSSKMAARSNLKELDQLSQSVHDLYLLRINLQLYTRDHNGKYPVDLEALKKFAEDFPWILENVEYLGKGKTVADSPNTIIAYDRELLNKIKGTNVLFNDSRIVFLSLEQLDEKLKGKNSDQSLEEQRPSDNLLAKSAVPSDEDKSIVNIDLSVVEVSSDSKMDRETIIEIRNLLGGKITIPDSPAVADLLRKAAKATAAIDDESAGDKRITQEQFQTLIDLLESRGYVKILMNPTLQVVDGRTAKIRSEQKIPSTQDSLEDSIQITPHVSKDSNIILQVEATLHQGSMSQSNEQTPIISTHEIATSIRLGPGESGIIGGTKQTGLITEPGKKTKESEVPATETLVILTPTIVASAEPKEPMETVNFKNIQAGKVIEKLAEWAGKTIIATDELMKQKITIHTSKKMTRSKAVELILNSLRSKGYMVEQTDDTIYLKSLPEEQSGTEAKEPPADYQQDRNDIKDEDTANKEYEVIQLSHIDAVKAANRLKQALQQTPELQKSIQFQLLEQTQQIIIFGKSDMRKKIKKLLAEIDQQAEHSEKLSKLGKALLIYAKEHNDRYPDSIAQVRQYLKADEFAWAQQNVTYYGKGRTVDNLPDMRLARDNRQADAKRGTNILFNDGRVEFIKPGRQKDRGTEKDKIQIDTRILFASDDFLKAIGLDANSIYESEAWSEHLTPESAAEPNSPTYRLILDELNVNLFTRAIAARMRTHKDLLMLTKPQVLVRDAKEAAISTRQEIAYISGYDEPNSPSEKPAPKIETRDTGTSIWLKPHLTPDKRNVYLEFESKVAKIMGFKERTYLDIYTHKIPLINTVEMGVGQLIPLGKTLLIVGKKITEEVEVESKIPILSKIPLVGRLFSNYSKIKDQKTLLIMIKPSTDIKAPPIPPPIDPNDPLIKKLEEKFNRYDEQTQQ